MNEKPENSVQVQQKSEPAEKPAWYDSLIKIVQDLLEFNMHTYKQEKVPRL